MKKIAKKSLLLILLLSLALGSASMAFALTEDSTALQTETSAYMKYLTQSYGSWEGWSYKSYVRLDINGVTTSGNTIQTTYNEKGYYTYIKVGNNSETEVKLPSLGGVATNNGVQTSVKASFVNNGKTIKVVYTLENTNSETTTVKIGSGADTDLSGTESGDCCWTYMSEDYQNLRMEFRNEQEGIDVYYTVTPDASTPFTGAWIGYYDDLISDGWFEEESKILTSGTVYKYGSDSANRGSTGDSAMSWYWSMDMAPNEVVEKVCYFQIANVLEVTNVQCIADAETGKINLIVDYTDALNRTQTLYYTPQYGSQGTATGATTTSNEGQFNIMADAPSSWKAGKTYEIVLHVEDNVGTVSSDYTFQVTWPEENPGSDRYSTLSFKNTSVPFADVRDVPNSSIVLPSDSKDGYIFYGWNSSADGTGRWYQAGDSYTMLYFDTNLYAQWGVAQNYSVSVLKDGAAYTGKTVELKSSSPSFTHTLTENNGVYSISGVAGLTYDVYVDGVDTGVDVSYASPSATINYWTVSYSLNGHGTGSIASQVVINGATATKPSDPTDSTYNFKGWFTEAACTNEFVFTNAVTGTTTLYAKWGLPGFDDAVVSDIADHVYDGKAYTPALTIKYNGKTLTAGTDYSVSYTNNVNVGTGTITITGIKYSGTITKTFKITPRTLKLTWGTNTFTYDGKSHVPALTVGNVVTGDTCTVAVSGAQVNAGSYTATAGTPSNSNYQLPASGTTKAFTINKGQYDMSVVKFEDATFEYDGTAKKIVITGTLPAGVTVTYENNERTDAGVNEATAKFAITDANYETPKDLTAKLTITALDVSGEAKIELGPQLIYNGLEQQQTIKSVTVDGKAITYKIVKNRGINAGEYPLVLEGTGNYKGQIETTFTIKPAKADMSNTLFEDKTVVEGPTHYLAVKNLPTGITVKYENNGQDEPGTYNVIAKFDGGGNYEPIDNMEATLHILRKTIDNSEDNPLKTDPIISVSNDNGFDDDVILVVDINRGETKLPNNFKTENDEDVLAVYTLHLYRVAEDGTRTELTMEDVNAETLDVTIELQLGVRSEDITRVVQFNDPVTEFEPGTTLNVESGNAIGLTVETLNDIAVLYNYNPCTIHYAQLILFAVFILFVILCRKHKLDALTIIGLVVLAAGTVIIYKMGYCDLCLFFTAPNIVAFATGLLLFISNGKKAKKNEPTPEEALEEGAEEAPEENAEAPAEETEVTQEAPAEEPASEEAPKAEE